LSLAGDHPPAYLRLYQILEKDERASSPANPGRALPYTRHG
jgi:hypothetical protein